MADNTLTLTAAELREIGERVDMEIMRSKPSTQAEIDCRRMYAALDRLIERCLHGELATQQIKNKDAAIDALLKEQPH